MSNKFPNGVKWPVGVTFKPLFDERMLPWVKRLTIAPVFPDYTRTFSETANAIARIQGDFFKALEPLRGTFARVAEEQRKAEQAEKAGWLPHYTTPFDKIVFDTSEEDVSRVIQTYYSEHWAAVETAFLQALGRYSLDAEAKETFGEALKLHRDGYYRGTVRLLFPEIERVASVEFYDGRTPAASLKELRETVANLPLGDVISFEYGLHLFKLIEGHMYDRVGDDAEVRAKYAADPVPNRHAALHGLVPYSTAKNSLNTLIMTDFLFHVMDRMKRYVSKTVAEEIRGPKLPD